MPRLHELLLLVQQDIVRLRLLWHLRLDHLQQRLQCQLMRERLLFHPQDLAVLDLVEATSVRHVAVVASAGTLEEDEETSVEPEETLEVAGEVLVAHHSVAGEAEGRVMAVEGHQEAQASVAAKVLAAVTALIEKQTMVMARLLVPVVLAHPLDLEAPSRNLLLRLLLRTGRATTPPQQHTLAANVSHQTANQSQNLAHGPTRPTGPRASRSDRPHPAIADLPQPIEGGQKAEPLVDRTKLDKLQEEAEKLRKAIEEKETRKRKGLKEWERLGRETEAAGYRSQLAEEALRNASGEAEGAAAF